MTPLQRAARWYADRGLHIFPLGRRSKFPLKASHGFLDAAPDASPWDSRPWANIGIACATSGRLIFDVDDDSILEELPKLPDTQIVISRPGRYQYHFAVKAGEGPIFRSVPGRLDIKWRGYGILPPSIHPLTGRAYQWDALSRIDVDPIADAPAWLAGPVPEHLRRPANGRAAMTLLGAAFEHAGLALGDGRDGNLNVTCPWTGSHTSKSGDSSTVIFPPREGEDRIGRFHCSHGHCLGARPINDVARALPADALRAAASSYRREFRTLKRIVSSLERA